MIPRKVISGTRVTGIFGSHSLIVAGSSGNVECYNIQSLDLMPMKPITSKKDSPESNVHSMLVIDNHIVLQEFSTNNLSVFKDSTLVKTVSGIPDERCSSQGLSRRNRPDIRDQEHRQPQPVYLEELRGVARTGAARRLEQLH